MTFKTQLIEPLDHGVVDWAAVRQEKGVAEVFHNAAIGVQGRGDQEEEEEEMKFGAAPHY